jgi:hypothetical protein
MNGVNQHGFKRQHVPLIEFRTNQAGGGIADSNHVSAGFDLSNGEVHGILDNRRRGRLKYIRPVEHIR